MIPFTNPFIMADFNPDVFSGGPVSADLSQHTPMMNRCV